MEALPSMVRNDALGVLVPTPEYEIDLFQATEPNP